MTFVAKIAIGALCAYAVIVAAAYFGQRKLMYFPDRVRTPPARVGLPDVEERVLVMPDGARVIAWYGKARPGEPTLLYFHGNGGGLADRAERIRRFMAEGWGILMMSYRGYSGSSGTPTELKNVADARIAYGALVVDGIEPQSIILYGESLGSGVAARIAAERPAGGLILDAPYTSVVDVAVRSYPYLPVRYLIADRYETDLVIRQVKVPLLILHGEQDRVIPVAMGRELAQMANEPKKLVIFPNGRHSDLYTNGNNAIEPVREWIRSLKGQ
jgi:hypothetical protein